jgi:hypothetical protein
MSATLIKLKPAGYGDVAPKSPLPETRDVLDALHAVGHGFPGHIAALAQRMGMPANTLNHKLNPSNDTHHVTVREFQVITQLSNDYSALYALCASLDHVALPVAAEAEGCVAERLALIGSEVGDVFRQVSDAVKDKRITPNERRRVRKEVAEAIQALNGLLQVL